LVAVEGNERGFFSSKFCVWADDETSINGAGLYYLAQPIEKYDLFFLAFYLLYMFWVF